MPEGMTRRLGGRFALEREIGAGGISIIFLGRDEVLDRPVAVKVLRGGFESSEVSARFRREGRTAASLSHPNIVQVYDAGEDRLDGREVSYIVMEYVSGGDLKGLIDAEGPLTEKKLARIGADVASGLAHAHEKGIIHRDIKPQNILIDEYGRPKLGDFGIARALDATQATQSGSYLGTASYSSPEQLRGAEITPKSDVYSFGCTLYEAATSEPPFSGLPLEVAGQQLTKMPASPRARGATVGEPFEALVLACLAKDAADRPDSASLQERLLRLSAVASGAATAPALGAVKGFETVARGLRNRANPAGAPAESTTVESARTSHRTFGRRRSWRPALAAGVVALLLLALVVAVVGASSLMGRGAEEEVAQVPEGSQDVAQAPAEEETTNAAEEETALIEEITDAPAEETTAAVSAPALPPSRAEEAVYDLYVKKSYGNVDASWDHLSQRLKNEVGSKENWAQREQLDAFRNVYFVRMPSHEVPGDDMVRINFQVREVRTGGSKLVTGTWECVNEGGEWKLNRFVDGNA